MIPLRERLLYKKVILVNKNYTYNSKEVACNPQDLDNKSQTISPNIPDLRINLTIGILS